MSHNASAFRRVPRTGVIFVTSEARKRGFGQEDGWCNLGQGQPEMGKIDGAPERVESLTFPVDDHEYAPVAGLPALREAVAAYYNRKFRVGKASQYTAENVAISAGGRLAIARLAVALGRVNLGHFLPDYTAYEELLDVFAAFNPIPILLEGERKYRFSPEDLEKEVLGRGLRAILMSNPCNPTGRTLAGAELDAFVRIARTYDCTLLMDEFYSHYIWAQPDGKALEVSSAASFVEDVDKDPVVIVDGLTKNWRYPGLRIAWTVGPKDVIEAVTSAGSFLDGGAPQPNQRAAIPLLNDDIADAETTAIRRRFSQKRNYLLSRLIEMGIEVELPPEGSFYIWGSVKNLPAGLNTDMAFFQAALDEKVITVPGRFFDIDPGQRKLGRPSRFEHHLRFSFGPSLDVLEAAVERLRAMIDRARG